LNLKKEAFIYFEDKELKYKKYFEGKDMGYWLVKKYHFLDYQPDIMYNAMFPELFENEKLVGLRTLSDIGKLRFVYDNNGFYCNDSVVILTLWHKLIDIKFQTIKKDISKEKINISEQFNYKYLQSILNSNLIKFYVNELFYDGTHFYPNHMKQLPIKNIALDKQKPFIEKVEQILEIKKADKNTDTSQLENEINEMVMDLYKLTNEQKEVIRKNHF